VFLVNVPFVLVAAPLGLRWLPESRRPGAPPLDLPGVALSSVGLTGIVFALIEGVDAGWTSPVVLVAAVLGVAATTAFFVLELHRADPLFDVRVLARARVAAGSLAILDCYVATLGMLFLLPQRVQYVHRRERRDERAARDPPRPRAVLLAGLLTAAVGLVPLLLPLSHRPDTQLDAGAVGRPAPSFRAGRIAPPLCPAERRGGSRASSPRSCRRRSPRHGAAAYAHDPPVVPLRYRTMHPPCPQRGWRGDGRDHGTLVGRMSPRVTRLGAGRPQGSNPVSPIKWKAPRCGAFVVFGT
jgi:hypothetical protein